MKDHFLARRDRLRRLLKKAQCDALLVTNYTNVTYLTGFSGDSSYVLLRRDGDLIISDSRYTEQIEEESPGLEMEIRGTAVSMFETLQKLMKQAKIDRLGIEADSMTLSQHMALDAKLAGVELIATRGQVEQLRMIKDRHEIASIRKSIDFAARGFAMLRASLRPDKTEIQIRDELEYNMRTFGAEDRGFDSIVGVGPRAALPHAIPTHRRVDSDNILLVDWGARADLYISDLTRVLVTGRLSAKLEKIYNIVLKAQTAAIEAIRPGVTGEEVDKVARGIITKAGYGKQFGHGLGHGLGLEVHENPRMSKGCTTELRPGMVVTVEPGIYIPGWGGVRIEDDILVTRDGSEVLSAGVSKQLEDTIVD